MPCDWFQLSVPCITHPSATAWVSDIGMWWLHYHLCHMVCLTTIIISEPMSWSLTEVGAVLWVCQTADVQTDRQTGKQTHPEAVIGSYSLQKGGTSYCLIVFTALQSLPACHLHYSDYQREPRHLQWQNNSCWRIKRLSLVMRLYVVISGRFEKL